jgi:hypothetical protein
MTCLTFVIGDLFDHHTWWPVWPTYLLTCLTYILDLHTCWPVWPTYLTYILVDRSDLHTWPTYLVTCLTYILDLLTWRTEEEPAPAVRVPGIGARVFPMFCHCLTAHWCGKSSAVLVGRRQHNPESIKHIIQHTDSTILIVHNKHTDSTILIE